jgi:hypothetical protein
MCSKRQNKTEQGFKKIDYAALTGRNENCSQAPSPLGWAMGILAFQAGIKLR